MPEAPPLSGNAAFTPERRVSASITGKGTAAVPLPSKMAEEDEMAITFFSRRDAFAAIAAGTLIAVALNVCYNLVAGPETMEAYIWLARIHEPAGRAAERLAHVLYPKLGYPWCVRFAVV